MGALEMVIVRIGNDSRRMEHLEESWITQQVVNRQREQLQVCIEVTIQTGDINVRLSTPGCGPRAGGGRQPSAAEAAIIRAWNDARLTSEDFGPGNVVAFLKKLRRLL
jgi:hypothetical protein